MSNRCTDLSCLALVAALAGLSSGCPRQASRLPETASDNVRRYARECDDGVAASCYALGLVFELGEETRQGVPRDDARARSLFERACDGGEAAACEELGTE